MPDRDSVEAVLETFELTSASFLGRGGEASVYAVDRERVLRVLHPGASEKRLRSAAELVANLRRSNPPFALPEVLEIGRVGDRIYAVERRHAGRSLTDELAVAEGSGRALLIESYLEAVACLGDLELPMGDQRWGDLLQDDPIRTALWADYLVERANRSLHAAGPDFRRLRGEQLASEMPKPAARSFVHLDAFPGNVLVSGTTVTAVIDIGPTALAGDRRLDPLTAVVYLAPHITPTATDHDRHTARRWLIQAGLSDWLASTERWIAAYWAFAVEDVRLHGWCRAVLLET